MSNENLEQVWELRCGGLVALKLHALKSPVLNYQMQPSIALSKDQSKFWTFTLEPDIPMLSRKRQSQKKVIKELKFFISLKQFQ